jgi:erythronate-4-phosphate dehydrogenase
VASGALRDAAGRLGGLVLDVWEHEPTPDPTLVRAADVATPHIAGYAIDGKVRGTAMLYRAFCRHLDVEPTWDPADAQRPESPDALYCRPPDPRLPALDALSRMAEQAYDIQADDRRMRGLLDHPPERRGDYFGRLRATYPRRRELRQHHVRRAALSDALRTPVADGLTVQLT